MTLHRTQKIINVCGDRHPHGPLVLSLLTRTSAPPGQEIIRRTVEQRDPVLT